LENRLRKHLCQSSSGAEIADSGGFQSQ
jgi:hypothetical protein